MRACITNPEGICVASDYAEEKRGVGVNKTSALENCATSAIGRALAAFGLAGSDVYASAEEMASATVTSEQATNLQVLVEEVGADLGRFLKYLEVDHLSNLPLSSYENAISALEAKRATR